MPSRVRLNRPGVSAVLRSAKTRSVIDALAEKVADNVRGQGLIVTSGAALPVTVSHYTTDRAAAAVVLAHPAGIGMQAKHGALTKAAADAGLEVRGGE